ncbi:hypothetical protein P8X24_10875 [Pyrococcus kukulkanii]|uniref:hypothetical protein n=1 Tax=Pyrococcus kukulkanii TaxID=1609559 RepID=UPI003569C353
MFIVENRGQEIVYYPVVRVYYSYEAPDREFGKPILVFERQPKELFPGETYKDWFKMTLTNPGKHHFTLYVNGKWEDEETITTTSKANIEAWMECAPELVSEDVDSVTCKVNVKNSGSASAEVWVTNIYFAGGEVYDRSSDNNLVNPNPSSLSLDPSSSGAFTFTIPINDELQERIPVDLSNINPGTPIAIKAYINQLKEPVMSVIEMNPIDLGDFSLPEKEIASGIGGGIAGALTYLITNEGATLAEALTAAGMGALSAYVSLGSILGFWIYLAYEGTKPVPSSDLGDNNLIVGDES